MPCSTIPVGPRPGPFALEQSAKAFINKLFGMGVPDSFELMTEMSNYETRGIRYVLPDHADAALSQ